MTNDCCSGAFQGRRYYTREEKAEWLKGYSEELENELKAVKERIAELSRA